MAALDALIKNYEADKAALEKQMKGAGKEPEKGTAFKKQVDDLARVIALAKKDRDAFARKPLRARACAMPKPHSAGRRARASWC